MEGVEDIPGTALAAGMNWGWESFPEYLDALDAQPRALDIGTQVPHGAVRAYVMGERGAKNQPATPEDIARMAALVREGIRAGALGFSTSRTLVHRAIDGEPVPGTFAAEDELFGIGEVLRELGAGLFELAPAGVQGEDLAAPEKEVAWMSRLSAPDPPAGDVRVRAARRRSRPVAPLARPDRGGQRRGRPAPAAGRLAARRTLLIGHPTFHPFVDRPSYRAARRRCRWTSASARLRDPELRRRILAEKPESRRPDAGRDRADPERTAQDLPAGRSARLRARTRAEREGAGRARWAWIRSRCSTTGCSSSTGASC